MPNSRGSVQTKKKSSSQKLRPSRRKGTKNNRELVCLTTFRNVDKKCIRQTCYMLQATTWNIAQNLQDCFFLGEPLLLSNFCLSISRWRFPSIRVASLFPGGWGIMPPCHVSLRPLQSLSNHTTADALQGRTNLSSREYRKKRKNIEDYVREFNDFEVLGKVDDEHFVCKWCRLSISGDSHYPSTIAWRSTWNQCGIWIWRQTEQSDIGNIDVEFILLSIPDMGINNRILVTICREFTRY